MKTFITVLFLSIFLLPFAVSASEERPVEKKEIYYVVFKEKTPKKFETSKNDINSVNQEGGKIKKNYNALGISTVELTKKQAEKLRKKKNIQSVDRFVNAPTQNTEWLTEANTRALNQTDAYTPWNFNFYSSNQFSDEIGFKGKGVNIAIMGNGIGIGDEKPNEIPESNIKARIDCTALNFSDEDNVNESGEIDYADNYLKPDLCKETTEIADGVDIKAEELVPEGQEPNPDAAGHENYVAQIIIGKHNDEYFEGIAPKANIYSIKVKEPYRANGSYQILGGSDDWIRGWNWILEHNKNAPLKDQISIINLSMTREATDEDDNPIRIPAEEEAVERLNKAGVLLVGTTGNFGKQTEIGYPAKYDSVITVGAVDSGGSLWSGSQIGPEVDIVAPGASLYLERTSPSWYDLIKGRKVYGTSFAAPMVAGALAILKEQYPKADAEELKWMLYSKSYVDISSSNSYHYLTYDYGDYKRLDNFKLPNGYGYGILEIGVYELIENSDQFSNLYGNDRQLLYEIKKDQTVYNYPSVQSPKISYGKDEIVNIINYWDLGKGRKIQQNEPQWAQLNSGVWIKKEDLEPGVDFYLWNNTNITNSGTPYAKIPQGKVKVMKKDNSFPRTYLLETEHNGKKMEIRQDAGTFEYDKIKTIEKTFRTSNQTTPYTHPYKSEEYWGLQDMKLPDIVTVDREWKDEENHLWYRYKNEQDIAWISEEEITPVN